MSGVHRATHQRDRQGRRGRTDAGRRAVHNQAGPARQDHGLRHRVGTLSSHRHLYLASRITKLPVAMKPADLMPLTFGLNEHIWCCLFLKLKYRRRVHFRVTLPRVTNFA